MKIKPSIWKFSLGTVFLVGVTVFASNPLRLPDKALHWWILRSVPVGSDLQELQAVAAQKGWRVDGTWQGNRPHSDWGGIDGHTVAWIYLGTYGSIFQTRIDSFWAFDEKGYLVDVHTRRIIDSL